MYLYADLVFNSPLCPTIVISHLKLGVSGLFFYKNCEFLPLILTKVVETPSTDSMAMMGEYFKMIQVIIIL